MCLRSTHNINDIFEAFITMFNIFPIIKKCKKTNIMEFHYQPKENNLIFFVVTRMTLQLSHIKKLKHYANNIK